MAMAILITAVLVFAVRGMFLGFAGVIGRVAGIVCGYWAAYSYRYQLAELVASQASISIPSIVIELLSGVALFFGGMIAGSLVIGGLVKGITGAVPGLKVLANRESLPSKCAGAVTNSALAVAIVLSGIWGYGLASGDFDHSDPLQQHANRFGESVFSIVQKYSNLSLADLDSNSLQLKDLLEPAANSTQSPALERSPQSSSVRGSAVIHSESNPEKTLSINSTTHIISEAEDDNQQPQRVTSDTIATMLDHQELLGTAQLQLEENPELLQQILNTPKLKTLLEFLQRDQNADE